MAALHDASVYVHILLYNSISTHSLDVVTQSISAACSQEEFLLGDNLSVVVTDNGSDDDSFAELAKLDSLKGAKLQKLDCNIGFSGGQNLAVSKFMQSNCDYLLILNPDCILESSALRLLVAGMDDSSKVGSVCPKLLKLDSSNSKKIDSVGMHITPELRHLDTGSGEFDTGQYDRDAYVFGASGACVLFSRDFIQEVSLSKKQSEPSLFRVFPQLKAGFTDRLDFFDEAFFAYREDADLAWRGQLLGWRCRYVNTAVGYHRRVVLPENRSELDPVLNKHGVRNRFLLQLNNCTSNLISKVFFQGILIRNLLVILGVIIKEQKSLSAFCEVFNLFERANARRREILSKVNTADKQAILKWFSYLPYRELIGDDE